MFAYLKEIQSLLIALIICISLFIFRAEVHKIVNWVVSFKRVSKTKDGYEASSDPGPSDRHAREEIESTTMIERSDTDEEDNGKKTHLWEISFINKDYPTAYSILKEKIEGERDEKKLDVLRGQLGFVKFKMNREDGVKYFDLAVSEGKVNSDLFYWYAFSYYVNDNYDEAIRVIKKGIELNPNSPSLYRLYTENLFEMGKGVESIEILKEEIHRNPEEMQYYKIAADMLAKIDMKSLARECYVIALAKDPNDESLLKKHADIASEIGLYKEAMQSYRQLTELAPSNKQYWALLGNQYLQLNLNDLALKAYRKANELAAEKEAWIISNIGNLLKNQQLYSEGVGYLKSALLLDPDSQYAHERLGQALKAAEEQEQEGAKIAREVQGLLREYRTIDAIVADMKSSRPKTSALQDS